MGGNKELNKTIECQSQGCKLTGIWSEAVECVNTLFYLIFRRIRLQCGNENISYYGVDARVCRGFIFFLLVTASQYDNDVMIFNIIMSIAGGVLPFCAATAITRIIEYADKFPDRE